MAVYALVGDACLVELDHVLACGDGYVDRSVGEECDPNDPKQAHKAACPNHNGGCDPDSCEIIRTDEQCAKCGDGVIDVAAGEECDGSNIGARCPGAGEPSCTLPSLDPEAPGCRIDWSTCDPCGNEEPDDGEECDASPDGGDLVTPVSCAGSPSTAPLRSPYVSYPYTSGTTFTCMSSCTYDRTNCGYCGNGVIDGPRLVSLTGNTQSLPEVCDGEEITTVGDPAYSMCTAAGARGNVACDDDCLGYEPRGGDLCCLPKNSPCPQPGDALRCCFELANPDATEVCLPSIMQPGSEGGSDGDSGGDDGGGPETCR